ncbi:MAG TPA: hypothetical protein VFF52_25415 [Isosphaeraceae bacterium]|nr:hypothetical protein [Isosphaeraceae bacterium]
MSRSPGLRRRFLMVAIATVLVPAIPAPAQNREAPFDPIVGQTHGLPQLPPQGAWGEIINVTSRWVVIQNHSGQQYPIAVDDLGEFLVRWPLRVEALGNRSMVEAVGDDLGSNFIRTQHVDVFEGADQSLVVPTYSSLLRGYNGMPAIDPGLNFMLNPLGISQMTGLYGWAYPMSPMLGAGTRSHVVGWAVNRSPLQLAVPGNNLVTVTAPPGEDFTVSQVTRGRVNYIRKGDYAFLMPQGITPRGLLLSQFVLYKTIPLRQFDPNAAAPAPAR